MNSVSLDEGKRSLQESKGAQLVLISQTKAKKRCNRYL